MSGGKRIDDHAFWGGSKPKGTVLPEGSKMKQMSDPKGAGHEAYYEDTAEAIEKVQVMGDSKVQGRKMKPGYRN